ncbi:MAG: EAL domain-containing protein, partial [Alphaproteobacteria bacterium]|nr:EAL domain-containing protein [Alphaproteobacteria bacterium]
VRGAPLSVLNLRVAALVAGLAALGMLAALALSLGLSAYVLALAGGHAAAIGVIALRRGEPERFWILPAIATGTLTGLLALGLGLLPGLWAIYAGETVLFSALLVTVLLAALPALAQVSLDPAARSEVRPQIIPMAPPPAVHEPQGSAAPALAAEARLARALDAAREGLWEWTIDEDALVVSPIVEEQLGEPPGTLTGSAALWAERLHPDDIELFRAALAAHLEDPASTLSVEFRMRHADGSHRWMLLRGQAETDAGGRVIACLGIVSDINARRSLDDHQDTDTLHDPLTGLATRALFLDHVERALADRPQGLGVFVIDVDRFGLVLDGLGLAAAEQVLRTLARRFESLADPRDTLARIGGDAFAWLTRRALSRSEALALARDIASLAEQPVTAGGREVFPSVSVGITLADRRPHAAGDLLHEAQTALFDAKRAGRGSARLYAASMRRAQSDRLAMETDLRRALERRQIELVYQPIMRLSDGKVAGFEGLLRWRHPARGLLSPKDFLSIAEETGFIVGLGTYALEAASRELAAWQADFPQDRPLFVSVNVSSRQFLADDFIEAVAKILRSQRLKPETLKLEVTESLIMEDPERSAALLKKADREGAGLALDDFGTGFSSLSYLQRFPFDTIKIDRSFIALMGTDADAAVIVKSIISLAKALKLAVVAEGAESEADADRLRALGCDFAQGYVFSPPLSSAEARGFIARFWKETTPDESAGAGAGEARPEGEGEGESRTEGTGDDAGRGEGGAGPLSSSAGR